MNARIYIAERLRTRAVTIAAAGALAAGLASLVAPEGPQAIAAAVPDAEAPVRLPGGYGYSPHDAAGFEILAHQVAALPEPELAQVAGFAAALAEALDRESPEALAGRIGDLIEAVDMAYGATGRPAPEAAGYDDAAIQEIVHRLDYDVEGLTDG